MLSRHSVGTFKGDELARNSSRKIRSQSFQLALPLWTGPGMKSGIGVRDLIYISRPKKKNAGGESIVEPSPTVHESDKTRHHVLCGCGHVPVCPQPAGHSMDIASD